MSTSVPARRPSCASGPVPAALLRTTTVLALGAVALTGCAPSAPGTAPAAASTSAASTSGVSASDTPASVGPSPHDAGHAAAAEPLTVEQAWAKAGPAGGMTGVFGTLVNEGDSPVVLTGATAEGVAGRVELHGTVLDPATGSTVMQPRQEPVVVAPGGSYALEPGADHLMLLDLRCDLRAGDEIELVLGFEDGAGQTVTAAVRDYAGAQEEYAPGGENGGPSGGAEHGGGHTAGSSDGSAAGPSTGATPAAAGPVCRG